VPPITAIFKSPLLHNTYILRESYALENQTGSHFRTQFTHVRFTLFGSFRIIRSCVLGRIPLRHRQWPAKLSGHCQHLELLSEPVQPVWLIAHSVSHDRSSHKGVPKTHYMCQNNRKKRWRVLTVDYAPHIHTCTSTWCKYTHLILYTCTPTPKYYSVAGTSQKECPLHGSLKLLFLTSVATSLWLQMSIPPQSYTYFERRYNVKTLTRQNHAS